MSVAADPSLQVFCLGLFSSSSWPNGISSHICICCALIAESIFPAIAICIMYCECSLCIVQHIHWRRPHSPQIYLLTRALVVILPHGKTLVVVFFPTLMISVQILFNVHSKTHSISLLFLHLIQFYRCTHCRLIH